MTHAEPPCAGGGRGGQLPRLLRRRPHAPHALHDWLLEAVAGVAWGGVVWVWFSQWQLHTWAT